MITGRFFGADCVFRDLCEAFGGCSHDHDLGRPSLALAMYGDSLIFQLVEGSER
jgi:hypothetical protein